MNILKHRSIFVIMVLFLSQFLNACSLIIGDNEEAVQTAAAETVTAEMRKLTETEAAKPTDTPIPSPTTLPTDTPTPTSETPVEPPTEQSSTLPTELVITGLEDTNCRFGPGPEYPREGALLKGTQSIVRGRNSSNTWWLIDNPGKSGQTCWVWGQTTQVQGDVAMAPVITPPPPPLGADFTAFFSQTNVCGSPTPIIGVTNTGGMSFKSMELSIEDFDAGAFYGPYYDDFPFMSSPNGCPPGGSELPPNATLFVGGTTDLFVAPGDAGAVYLVLCTEPGLGGECVEVSISFFF